METEKLVKEVIRMYGTFIEEIIDCLEAVRSILIVYERPRRLGELLQLLEQAERISFAHADSCPLCSKKDELASQAR